MTKLLQCWDDGVTTDVRLVELLRRHGAKASFNLNAGLHAARRQPGWVHRGTEVWRLAWDEMREVYRGFTMANHSLTHPYLDRLPLAEARRDIVQARAGGAFYFWSHSCEMVTEAIWMAFESTLQRLGQTADAQW